VSNASPRRFARWAVGSAPLWAWCAWTSASVALALSCAAAGCGRTELDALTPLPKGTGIPVVPTFNESVNSDLDIIFMIDNSGSMREEQDNLGRNFPVFMSALEGLPEGLPNLHIGVLSSDLGAGRFAGAAVEGCTRVGGDQGIFQAAPRGRGGTCTSAPKTGNFISVNGAKQNFDGSVSDALSCIAALGIRGCGYEHQIGSIWRALGGDGDVPAANRDFLRDDALLAIVIVTDEDDCSAPDDTDLFDPSQTLITDPLGPIDSYRCNEFGHLCNGVPPPRTTAATNLMNCQSNENGKLMRVADFVTFFKSLKASPDDVIVAAITGPVTPYSVELVRARDRGNELEPRIVPSCMSSNGSAAPAVRIQQFIEGFGVNGTIESICDGDFSPAMARIGDKIAGRIRHQCLEAPPVDRDTTRPGIQANCEVYEETTTTGGVIRTSIRACDDTEPPCWRIEPDSTCPGTGSEVVVDRGATPAAPRTRVVVLCETCDKPGDARCGGL
jgi:hypothetical protein